MLQVKLALKITYHHLKLTNISLKCLMATKKCRKCIKIKRLYEREKSKQSFTDQG